VATQAPQCQPTNSDSQSMSALPQPPIQSSSRGSTINHVPGTAPARHQALLSARLMGAGQLTTPRSFPNDADHRAGRPPHPATWASLPDTSAWTVTRNCLISQYIHQWRCSLRCPFPANPLSQAVLPTWISTTTPGRRRCRHFHFCKHVTCFSVNMVNRLTSLFPHG